MTTSGLSLRVLTTLATSACPPSLPAPKASREDWSPKKASYSSLELAIAGFNPKASWIVPADPCFCSHFDGRSVSSSLWCSLVRRRAITLLKYFSELRHVVQYLRCRWLCVFLASVASGKSSLNTVRMTSTSHSSAFLARQDTEILRFHCRQRRHRVVRFSIHVPLCRDQHSHGPLHSARVQRLPFSERGHVHT